MAQVGIREFDAKSMYFDFIGETYAGISVDTIGNIPLGVDKKYVVKPDMLFGKRGKYGLLGIGLDAKGIENWLKEKYNSQVEISGVKGTLTQFLIEPFVAHSQEYYVSFSSSREYDSMFISQNGGIDIEENWESVDEIKIPVLDDLKQSSLESLSWIEQLGDNKAQVIETLMSLWNFYKTYGFVYLEVNPFCFDSDSGNLVLLDMVAKVDDQEIWRQKDTWGDLYIPNTFGYQENQAEQYIRTLDSQTGASLKMKILNPKASIWTLFAGGGGSLILTDTLGALGHSSNIGNYGELSGNPSREFTREYTKTLLGEVLKNGQQKTYLIIAGAIANFTHIDTTFTGIIDVLEAYETQIKKHNIHICVRRGGINEKKGLGLIEQACNKMDIPIIIADSSEYMTDILKEIKL